MTYYPLLFMGLVWLIYGVAGLLGFQNIPATHKRHSWTKRYKRALGLSWLLLSMPWLILWGIGQHQPIRHVVLLVFLCSLPSLIYTFLIDRKYKSLLGEETT